MCCCGIIVLKFPFIYIFFFLVIPISFTKDLFFLSHSLYLWLQRDKRAAELSFLQEHLTKFLSFISVSFPGISGCKHEDQARNLWCCTLEALLDAADCSNSIHGQPITTWTVSRTSGDLVPELFPGGKWRDFFFTALAVTAT